MRFRVLATYLLVIAAARVAGAAYTSEILVANDASYNPTVMVDPLLLNPWGVSLRPPGAGGHIWVSNAASGTTTTYIGDVHDSHGNFTPLHQDSLTVVNIGLGARTDPPAPMPTGQVYNGSPTDFIVSGEGITGPSKFIFVSAEGTISGWTEVPDPLPGDPDHKLRQTTSVVVVDQSSQFDDDRLRYTGVAVTDFASNNNLFVTNYITNEVEVYDNTFQRLHSFDGKFAIPTDIEGDFHAWNVQYLHTGPNGEGRLWVAYSEGDDPWEQRSDTGHVAEFDLDGNLIKRLSIAVDTDPFADSELRAPWGLALAPSNFGEFSGALIVANFGDGSFAAYDPTSGQFLGFIKDSDGNVITIDGLWGLTFGNGVLLGDSNALYFTAGPNTEQDGMFGSIRVAGQLVPEPSTLALATAALVACGLHRWRVRRRAH